MIVEAVRVRECGSGIERSARVRWSQGEFVLRTVAPARLADATPDASAFLCATLPLAMRLGEDLELEGPTSPGLLSRCETIQRAYTAWDPELRACSVRAAEAVPGKVATGWAVFFSRGVDSTFAAARDRAGPRRLTHLVFADGLDPTHDERVRAEEVRRARAAAKRLALPLAVIETNLRQLTDPLTPGWENLVAPALAFVAHGLAGGLGNALVPSADDYATVEPCGTSPLLDPLFSTERVRIEHDVLTHSRIDKVAWLASERPDLLEQLKVCFVQNRPDNCGRCGKCLLTMASLQAAGSLHLATEFPDTIALDAVGELRLRSFKGRSEWANLCRSPGVDEPLKQAVLDRLRATVLTARSHIAQHGSALVEPRSMRDHRLNAMLSLMLAGRPYSPAPGGSDVDPQLGLVRAVCGERHVYAVGGLPDGEIVGELGALHRRPDPASVPVWLTDDGQLASQGLAEVTVCTLGRRARWALAPLGWRGFPGRMRRARAVLWRARRLFRAPLRSAPPAGEPLGFLHRDGAPGRLALYTARHPVLGDQLLSTRAHEAEDLGYLGTALLGYLDAEAPVTGSLGTGRPHLPWASRFGQRLRP